MSGLNPPLLATTTPVTSVPSPLSGLDTLVSSGPPDAAAASTSGGSNNLADALAGLSRNYAQSALNSGLWYDETGHGHYTSARTAAGRTHSLQTWAASLPGLCHLAATGRRTSAWDHLSRLRSHLDGAFLDQHPLLLGCLLHSLCLGASADADAAAAAPATEETSASSDAASSSRSFAVTLSTYFYTSACSVHGPDHPLVQLLALVDRALTEAAQQQQTPQPAQWASSTSIQRSPLLSEPILSAFTAAIGSQIWVFAKTNPGCVDPGAGHLSARLTSVLREGAAEKGRDQSTEATRIDAKTVSKILLAFLQGPQKQQQQQQSPSGGHRDASLSPIRGGSSASESPGPGPALSPPTPPYGPQPTTSRERVLRLMQHLRYNRNTHIRLCSYETYFQFYAKMASYSNGGGGGGGRGGGSLDTAFDEFIVGGDPSAAYTTTPRTSIAPTAGMLPAVTGTQHRPGDPYGVYHHGGSQQLPPPQQPPSLMGHDVFYPSADSAAPVSSASSTTAGLMAMPMTPATTTPSIMSAVPPLTSSSGLLTMPDAATTPRTTSFGTATGHDARSNANDSPHNAFSAHPPHAHHPLHTSSSLAMALGGAPTTGAPGSGGLLAWNGGHGSGHVGGMAAVPHLGMGGGASSAGAGNTSLSLSGELEDVVNMENWV